MPKNSPRSIAVIVLVLAGVGVVFTMNRDRLDEYRAKLELQRELREVQGKIAELDELLQSGYLTRSEREPLLAERGKVVRDLLGTGILPPAERSQLISRHNAILARKDAPRAGGALLAGAPGAAPTGRQDDEDTLERVKRWRQASDDPDLRTAWIADRCRDKWGGDFVMQDWCRNQQAEGFTNYRDILRNWGAADRDATVAVVTECVNTWVDSTPDWVMLHWCLNEQFKAYSRLRR